MDSTSLPQAELPVTERDLGGLRPVFTRRGKECSKYFTPFHVLHQWQITLPRTPNFSFGPPFVSDVCSAALLIHLPILFFLLSLSIFNFVWIFIFLNPFRHVRAWFYLPHWYPIYISFSILPVRIRKCVLWVTTTFFQTSLRITRSQIMDFLYSGHEKYDILSVSLYLWF